MRIKILSSAMDDLYEARLFYEKQGESLGDYFFDSLFSESTPWCFMVEYMEGSTVITGCFLRGFRMPSITPLKRMTLSLFKES